MLGNFARTTALAAAAAMSVASAQAAIGDGVLGARAALVGASQVENAQFFFGGQNYCWYDDGWRGPGWYWCGYEFNNGYGWGGVYGWNGWSRRGHGRHDYHGGPRPGFQGGVRPGFQGGGAHVARPGAFGAGHRAFGGAHPGGGHPGGGHPGGTGGFKKP